MSYLSWEDTWHWGGTSRVTGRVGERLTGSQQSSLLLGCHDLLSSCWTKSKTFTLNKTHSPPFSTTTTAQSLALWSRSERDTYHQWRLCSRWGRMLHRFHSKCSAAHLSRVVWPWHHQLLWGWCCWSYLGKAQQKSTSANIWNQSTHCVWREGPTLSADYYERNLGNRPVDSELVVDFVNFLEAGLIFQTEDQDNCIYPTCKLKRNGGEEK